MLNTHIILEMKKEKVMGEDIYADIFNKIISYLKTKDIECGKIKPGALCLYCSCKLKNKRLTIVVYGDLLPPVNNNKCDKVKISIQCKNEYPIWRYIFRSPSDEEKFSGEILQDFIRNVNEAIHDNNDLVSGEWINKEQFWSAPHL